MKIQTNPVLQAAEESLAIAETITGLLDGPSMVGENSPAFAELLTQLDCLPLGPSDTCFLRNTINDAQNLCGRGEENAARWQMQQVVGRLRKFRNEWADNGTRGRHARKTRGVRSRAGVFDSAPDGIVMTGNSGSKS